MKIEIELEEVESLRHRLSESKKRIEILEEKLKQLSESDLKQRALDLSYRRLNAYIKAIFQKMGFSTDTYYHSIEFEDNLDRMIGYNWNDKPEQLKVEIGAHVTEAFTTAFLKIGVIRKDKINEIEDLLKL